MTINILLATKRQIKYLMLSIVLGFTTAYVHGFFTTKARQVTAYIHVFESPTLFLDSNTKKFLLELLNSSSVSTELSKTDHQISISTWRHRLSINRFSEYQLNHNRRTTQLKIALTSQTIQTDILAHISSLVRNEIKRIDTKSRKILNAYGGNQDLANEAVKQVQKDKDLALHSLSLIKNFSSIDSSFKVYKLDLPTNNRGVNFKKYALFIMLASLFFTLIYDARTSNDLRHHSDDR